MNRYILYGMLAAALLPGVASAATFDFSYNINGSRAKAYGFDKREKYDVAIRLNDPAMIGAKITGFRVMVYGTNTSENEMSGWLSSGLKLSDKENAPDITSKNGTLDSEGYLNITFDTPYEIPEEGVYVGYTVNVADLIDKSGSPVAVAEGFTNPDGLYIHSSRTKLKWVSVAEEANANSAMTVMLEGNFPETGGSLILPEKFYMGKDDADFKLPATFVNKGRSEVTSFDYSYTIAGDNFSGTYTFTTPVPGYFGQTRVIDLPLDAVKKSGKFTADFTVTKVNGIDNTVGGATSSTEAIISGYVPVTIPLVEEYTGLWCGYCPRGYVALETMKERYPERFVSVAFHSNDQMEARLTFPNKPSGYPYAYINRAEGMDPYYIYSKWPEYAEKSAPAGIDVNVIWDGVEHDKILVTATTRFTESESNAYYRICYILVNDGMSDPTWQQANKFSGMSASSVGDEMPGKWGEIFLNGKSKVTGLIFNDVAIAASDMKGVPNSVPKEIVAEEAYEHQYTFNLKGLLNAYGKQAYQDKDKLRVIAAIVDSRSRIVNCCTSGYMKEASTDVPTIGTDVNVISTEYYDLGGSRVYSPESGIYIKVEIFSDGHREVTKEVYR